MNKLLPTMTADELTAIVRQAVRDELNASGLRVDEPEDQDAARRDFLFLRTMRLTFNGAASKIGGAVILALVGGLFWLLSMGVQSFLPPK